MDDTPTLSPDEQAKHWDWKPAGGPSSNHRWHYALGCFQFLVAGIFVISGAHTIVTGDPGSSEFWLRLAVDWAIVAVNLSLGSWFLLGATACYLGTCWMRLQDWKAQNLMSPPKKSSVASDERNEESSFPDAHFK